MHFFHLFRLAGILQTKHRDNIREVALQGEDFANLYCFLNYLRGAPDQMRRLIHQCYNYTSCTHSCFQQRMANRRSQLFSPGLLHRIHAVRAVENLLLRRDQPHPNIKNLFPDQLKSGKDFCRPLHRFRVLFYPFL